MLIYKQELPMDTMMPIKVTLPFSSAAIARKSIMKLDLQYEYPVMWYQAERRPASSTPPRARSGAPRGDHTSRNAEAGSFSKPARHCAARSIPPSRSMATLRITMISERTDLLCTRRIL